MPTGKSDFATKLASTGLHDRANQRARARTQLLARDSYTMLGTEAAAEFIDLGPLMVEGCLNVEGCRIRFTGAQAINVTGKLQRVTPAGVVTDLTAAATLSGSAPVSFTPWTSGEAPQLNRDDRLRFVWGSVTTATAGKILHFEIAYDVN